MSARAARRALRSGIAVAVTVAAAALAAACSRGLGDGPPEVHFGQDVCAACTMIVSEDRFAAAVVPDEGRGDPLAFDDIGCLFAWETRNPDAALRGRWVRDHAGSGWLRAEEAWYVRSPDLHSPMGSGVAAVTDGAAARALGEERQGRAMTWTQLREEAAGGLVRPPDPAGSARTGKPERSEG